MKPRKPATTSQPATTDHPTSTASEQAEVSQKPAITRYQLVSSSRKDVVYTLEVNATGNVKCSCPGFDHRGKCSHATAPAKATAAVPRSTRSRLARMAGTKRIARPV